MGDFQNYQSSSPKPQVALFNGFGALAFEQLEQLEQAELRANKKEALNTGQRPLHDEAGAMVGDDETP